MKQEYIPLLGAIGFKSGLFFSVLLIVGARVRCNPLSIFAFLSTTFQRSILE